MDFGYGSLRDCQDQLHTITWRVHHDQCDNQDLLAQNRTEKMAKCADETQANDVSCDKRARIRNSGTTHSAVAGMPG